MPEEHKRLLEAEREQRRLAEASHQLAEALREASAALNSTLDYKKVIDTILEQISRVIPNDATNVMLIEDYEEGTARVFRGRGYEKFGTADTLTTTTLNVKEVLGLRQMQQTGQPLTIPNVEHYQDWVYARPEHTWIKSYVGTPIIIGEQVAGFLNVNSATPNFYSQAETERLQTFAHHAAVAIENARLYRQSRQELAERIRMEEELRNHHEHLECLVAERTAELTKTVTEAGRLNEELAEEITERKRVEEELRQSEEQYKQLYAEAKDIEERYHSLLESTPDAIVTYDLEGNTLFISYSA